MSDLIACGKKPATYDAEAKSEDERCPHCGEVIPRENWGYGLAAGGCGFYRWCDHCERYCDAVQDDD